MQPGGDVDDNSTHLLIPRSVNSTDKQNNLPVYSEYLDSTRDMEMME